VKIIRKLPDLPATLADQHLAQFNRTGYLAFRNLLSETEIDALKEGMRQLCLETVRGIEAGRCELRSHPRGTTNICTVNQIDSDLQIQFEPGVDVHALDDDALVRSYRKFMWFIDAGDTFRRLKTNPKISGVRDALLGPGSILFQDMALSKPARIGTEKPWHQDLAYFTYTPLEEILGIWIALDDATLDNGCMQVIPSLVEQRVSYKHTHVLDCDINEKDLDLSRAEAVEIPAGGVMFFSGLLPHHTPPNHSDQSRRALQLHYRGANTTLLDKKSYARVFMTPDGRPAACEN
jgi:hypothetical protein